MNDIIVGIDLGTTNSEISIVRNGQVVLIPVEAEQPIFPSAIGVDANGELLSGSSAKNQQLAYPERTILYVKRKMGTHDVLTLGEHNYFPEEISAMILKQLKHKAEDYLQCSIDKGVITVPAYFSDIQRQATKKAGELAGLDVVRIINEPTAAALAYNTSAQSQKTVLVYDLGGGTFDVSVVKMNAQLVEVLASHGNNHLGGNDFDHKIIDYITQHLSDQGIDISQNKKAQARIRHASEAAKIILSDHPYATIKEEYLIEHEGKPYHLLLELSRHEYEEMIMEYIDETMEAVHIALKSAGIMVKDIEQILLVGGSTRTPLISQRLESEFCCPLHTEINPDLCVAMGAAIQAATIAGNKVSTVLVDITPYTFGTSYLGQLEDGCWSVECYKPIIKKNTPIPVTKSEVFATLSDNQQEVEVSIFQGENADALQNIKLGTFTVHGLRKVPAGNQIIISLQLDLNGILQVTAKEKKTGLQQSITINNAFTQAVQEELQDAKRRINHLFNDTIETNPLIKRAKAQLIKAQERLSTLKASDQEDLIELIAAVQDAINHGESDVLEQTLESLNDLLFYCEQVTDA